ncbi:MAG: hypothetical protein WCP93_03625 [Candidatus Berkelbacteria bacterium]
MNKKLFATLAIAAMLIPSAVFASSTADQIAAKQTKSYSRITTSIAWFNKEITIINSKKGITADRKAFLINVVNADIAIMNQMKTDISKVTDLPTVKKDYNSINLIYDGLKSGVKAALKA